MTTVRSVINGALRKIGRLGGGREPRQADQTDALAALQGLYSSWIASGAFGRLRDVTPLGTVYIAQGNERIYRQDASTLTVELPELVQSLGPGCSERYVGTQITITTSGTETTVEIKAAQPIGWATTPRDGSAVVISDAIGGNTSSWIYNGTDKVWQQIDLLQLDSEAPLSSADPEGLSAALALELGDTFGAEIGPTTGRQATRFHTALTQRFGMRREIMQGVYF